MNHQFVGYRLVKTALLISLSVSPTVIPARVIGAQRTDGYQAVAFNIQQILGQGYVGLGLSQFDVLFVFRVLLLVSGFFSLA